VGGSSLSCPPDATSGTKPAPFRLLRRVHVTPEQKPLDIHTSFILRFPPRADGVVDTLLTGVRKLKGRARDAAATAGPPDERTIRVDMTHPSDGALLHLIKCYASSNVPRVGTAVATTECQLLRVQWRNAIWSQPRPSRMFRTAITQEMRLCFWLKGYSC
jgi:hypothetical protein